jgi:hypothetical protein
MLTLVFFEKNFKQNKSVATDIRAIFNAPNGDEAKRQLDLFIP